MPLIDTESDPTPKERNALGVALCALGGVVAVLIWHSPEGLLFIGYVAGAAWCASMLFNKDEPVGRQWKGVIVPLIASLVYAAVRYTGSPSTMAVAAAIALVAVGVSIWFRARFGNWFYKAWSQMFLPTAWTVSTLLLVLVYFSVLTPIGLMLRIVGRDPMHRQLDRDGTSYWIKRNEVRDPERYFRQF